VALRFSIVLFCLIFFSVSARADQFWPLYRAQAFFHLRAELPPPQPGDSEDIRFLRAATLAAFGRTVDSSQILTGLLAHRPGSRPLEERARELLMINLRSQFQYPAALHAVSPLLAAAPAFDSANVHELRNRAALLTVIADVPAQTVRSGSGSPLAVDANGQVRVLLGRGAAHMAFDTGANFSVLTRSAAVGLGLPIRHTDYAIGSSLGGRVQADVAVVDFSFADGTRITNALFLVLPDRALRLANGRSADGLIGLPVIAALGRIEFRPGQARIDAGAGRGGATDELALGSNDPLLRISYRQHELLCRLDTGAARSVFYEPFYRLIADMPSRRYSTRIGGTTGTRAFDARDLGSLNISIAGRTIALRHATVLTVPIHGSANAGLACEIGRDAFLHLPYYAIDLKRLTLTLGPAAGGPVAR
jgi:hypothetical protein